jgi:hypothetical protein
MDASVNIGVLFAVIELQAVDHGLRFLAGGRVVEINQELSVDFLMEDREVPPDFLYVERSASLLR